METIGDRIRHVRLAVKNRTQTEFAQLLGVTRGAVGNWELDQGVKTENLMLISKKAGVSLDWLATGIGAPKQIPAIQIIGLVGAGSAMIIYSEGDPHDDWVPAPAYANEKTLALEIRGTSLGAHFNGWVLFYDDVRSPVTDDLIGRLCVVCLDDGRVLVKEVRRGQLPNKFNLLSIDPPIYDVMIVWAALVKGIEPR